MTGAADLQPRITAVCVVRDLMPEPTNPDRLTAIGKVAVRYAVPVGPYGLAGDLVKDHRHHGGITQAVYLYADEDAAALADECAFTFRPGLFGENLRSLGIDVNQALIGERWRIGNGGLELELTSPRIPCATFARHMARYGLEERGWVKKFTQFGCSGGYFAVTSPGDVAAGDGIEVSHRPSHDITLGEMFAGEQSTCRRLLEAEADGAVTLHDKVRLWATKHSGR